MPAQTSRKVMKHGRFSGVVALPTDYRRYHNLQPGTPVKILYDNLLLVIPPEAEGKAAQHKELIRRLLE
jgi:hypothetical protein